MGIGYYNALATAQAAGPNLTASTTATSLLPTQARIALPGCFLAYPGQKLIMKAQGQIGNVITTPGTLTLTWQFDTNVLWTGVVNFSAIAHTTIPFWLDVELTTRAVGTTGNVMALGRMTSQAISTVAAASADTINTLATVLYPVGTPAVSANFDTTLAVSHVDFIGQWSLNNANAITVHQYELISPNWGG